MRCLTRALILTVAVGVSLSALAAPALADTDPKRTVAVLEYRAGSAELEAIDRRSSQILRKNTSLSIIDADDARKSFGNQIDREIVDCAGEAACIAEIGAQLDADEVLLVGVSEFGDVILTLQRIDVRHKKVAARIAEALAPGVSPSTEELADYLRRVLPKEDFIRYGVIRIDANVAGARVTIGETKRGKTPIKPLRVPAPATYEIELVKEGYVPFHASVAVPPDAEVDVRPVLTRRGGSGAWYAKWWVAAIAGTLVVGATTAGVLMLRGDPTDVGVKIPPF